MLNLPRQPIRGLTICVGSSTKNSGTMIDLNEIREWNRWDGIFARDHRVHIHPSPPLIDAVATKDRILDTICEFVRDTPPYTTGVIVYFGHGVLVRSNREDRFLDHYLLAGDSDVDDTNSLISEADLKKAIYQSMKKDARIVVVVDACRLIRTDRTDSAQAFVHTDDSWKERQFMSAIAESAREFSIAESGVSPEVTKPSILVVSSCSDKQYAFSLQIGTHEHESVFGHYYQHVTTIPSEHQPLSFDEVINKVAMHIQRHGRNQTPFVNNVELAKKWEAA